MRLWNWIQERRGKAPRLDFELKSIRIADPDPSMYLADSGLNFFIDPSCPPNTAYLVQPCAPGCCVNHADRGGWHFNDAHKIDGLGSVD